MKFAFSVAAGLLAVFVASIFLSSCATIYDRRVPEIELKNDEVVWKAIRVKSWNPLDFKLSYVFDAYFESDENVTVTNFRYRITYEPEIAEDEFATRGVVYLKEGLTLVPRMSKRIELETEPLPVGEFFESLKYTRALVESEKGKIYPKILLTAVAPNIGEIEIGPAKLAIEKDVYRLVAENVFESVEKLIEIIGLIFNEE